MYIMSIVIYDVSPPNFCKRESGEVYSDYLYDKVFDILKSNKQTVPLSNCVT